VKDPVLITGVNGFIGAYLAERLLRAGVRVRGLDVVRAEHRPRVEFFQGDLTVPDNLPPAVRGARVVVHCARWNGSPPNSEAARAIDITGTGNLLAACLHAGVERVVHLSSVAVYGPTRRAVITEETPFWPVDAYGRSKVAAEDMVARAVQQGLPVVTLRPGLAYGPRAFGGTVNPARQIMAGWPVLAAGGRGIANPVYIEHLLDALIAAATREKVAGQAFNVADDNLPWREFFGYYARMCRRPLRSSPAFAVWLFGLATEVLGTVTRRPPLTHRTLVHYMTRPTRCSTEKPAGCWGGLRPGPWKRRWGRPSGGCAMLGSSRIDGAPRCSSRIGAGAGHRRRGVHRRAALRTVGARRGARSCAGA